MKEKGLFNLPTKNMGKQFTKTHDFRTVIPAKSNLPSLRRWPCRFEVSQVSFLDATQAFQMPVVIVINYDIKVGVEIKPATSVLFTSVCAPKQSTLK